VKWRKEIFSFLPFNVPQKSIAIMSNPDPPWLFSATCAAISNGKPETREETAPNSARSATNLRHG